MTRKTRKNLSDKEIKKLVKLIAAVKKCQIKNCNGAKWWSTKKI